MFIRQCDGSLRGFRRPMYLPPTRCSNGSSLRSSPGFARVRFQKIHLIMDNPSFNISFGVLGLANNPAPIFKQIVTKKTALVFHTVPLSKFLIGTSNPMVHAKNNLMSHCRILLICPCHTTAEWWSVQKHSPARKHPRRYLFVVVIERVSLQNR